MQIVLHNSVLSNRNTRLIISLLIYFLKWVVIWCPVDILQFWIWLSHLGIPTCALMTKLQRWTHLWYFLKTLSYLACTTLWSLLLLIHLPEELLLFLLCLFVFTIDVLRLFRLLLHLIVKFNHLFDPNISQCSLRQHSRLRVMGRYIFSFTWWLWVKDNTNQISKFVVFHRCLNVQFIQHCNPVLQFFDLFHLLV